MSTTIDGVVTHCSVSSPRHPETGRLLANRVRVLIRQHGRGAPPVEAVVDAGPGNDGMTKADAMRARLRPGTPCQAVGIAVVRPRGAKEDPDGKLVLRGCEYVRGGEQTPYHERTAQEAA